MKIKETFLRHTLCGVSLALLSQSAVAVFPSDQSNIVNPRAIAAATNKSIVTPRFIVKYVDSANTRSLSSSSSNLSAMAAASGHKMKVLRETATGAYVVQVQGDMTQNDIQNMVQEMSGDPNIEYFVKDQLLQVMATPSDPRYGEQWHYFEADGGLNLPDAWDNSTGEGVVVAVIDTGITNHSDLRANILPGYDMISDATIANDGDGRDADASDTGDATANGECSETSVGRNSSWHGTHVAGTVAAVANNGRGVAGVAYNAKVVPVRALGRCGGFTSDIADSMIWAAGGRVPGVPTNRNPAQVLNLSLGGSGSCNAASQDAINQAVALGTTVVIAAGNSSTNVSGATPANCNNVVSVAAIGRSGARASYSNFGNLVDVAAPGGDQLSGGFTSGVLSTLNTGRTSPQNETYQFYQGTSMAAPHVAGAAALLYSLNRDITPAEVENILETTARAFSANCGGCGAGVVDAAAAVATQVSTPDSATFIIASNQTISRWNGSSFERFGPSGGRLVRIDVGENGLPWGINRAGNIYEWTGSRWVNRGANGQGIAVGGGEVFLTRTDDTIWRWNGSSFERFGTPGGRLQRIDVGADGVLWGINVNNDVYQWNGRRWLRRSSDGQDIAVGGGNVFMTRTDDTIWRWNGSSFERFGPSRSRLQNIDVGEDGVLWGVNVNGMSYFWNGSRFINVGDNALEIGR